MDFGFPRLQQWLGLSPCSNLRVPVVPGAEVIAMVAADVHNFSLPAYPPYNPHDVAKLNFCNVSVVLRHEGADDTVYVDVWLPLQSQWNGRYQATGGGGLAAGVGALALSTPASAGYAVSSTDAGLTFNQTIDPQSGAWGLRPDGTLNEPLHLNFAWRSLHDMAVVSKDLIQQYYGKAPSYSYWTGCSQGGRQGYAAAAKYPDDFDGIMANAPALDAINLAIADFWPAVVMQSLEVVPFCVFEAYQAAIVEKCDPLDGIKDGLISDPDLLASCLFDPSALVGTTVPCEDNCIEFDPATNAARRVPCTGQEEYTVTKTDAEVTAKILEGPATPDGESLWYGLAPGAGFNALALTEVNSDGDRVPKPFPAAQGWVKYIAVRDPDYDTTKMVYADFFKAWKDNLDGSSDVWGNHQLDLSGFQKAGGKLLTWNGLADEYISPRGMLAFRDDVENRLGGPEVVDEFFRLFLAPGAGHCSGGVGPNPVSPLEALVAWVERGEAPDTLSASTKTDQGIEVTRDLCRYPKKLVYKEGDVNLASSFTCQ